MPYSDRQRYADAEGVLSNISSGTGLIVHSDNIVILGKMLETLEPGQKAAQAGTTPLLQYSLSYRQPVFPGSQGFPINLQLGYECRVIQSGHSTFWPFLAASGRPEMLRVYSAFWLFLTGRRTARDVPVSRGKSPTSWDYISCGVIPGNGSSGFTACCPKDSRHAYRDAALPSPGFHKILRSLSGNSNTGIRTDSTAPQGQWVVSTPFT